MESRNIKPSTWRRLKEEATDYLASCGVLAAKFTSSPWAALLRGSWDSVTRVVKRICAVRFT